MKGANIFFSLGMFSLLLVAQPARKCYNPYYPPGAGFQPRVYSIASRPPFRAKLEPMFRDWLMSAGIVRYGMTISEVKEALSEAGDMCGAHFTVKPFEITENGVTHHAPYGFAENPPFFHGKPFTGKYYLLFGRDPETKYCVDDPNAKDNYRILNGEDYSNGAYYRCGLAVMDGKVVFIGWAHYYSYPEGWIQYLPGDKETENLIRKKMRPESRESLDKWITIEKDIYNFLQTPHTEEETESFVKKAMAHTLSRYWKITARDYENDDWGTFRDNDHIYCIRGPFKASKILELDVIDGVGDYLEVMGMSKILPDYQYSSSDDVFHAYFDADNQLIAVAMHLHQMEVGDEDLDVPTNPSNKEIEWVPSYVLKFWRIPPKPGSENVLQ